MLLNFLTRAAEDRASDVFIVPGAPVTYKLEGLLTPMETEKLTQERSAALVRQIYDRAQRSIDSFEATGDDDFSFSVPGVARFRSTLTGSGAPGQR